LSHKKTGLTARFTFLKKELLAAVVATPFEEEIMLRLLAAGGSTV